MINQAGPGRARTAADGSYTIDVAPGRPYMVYVSDDEWAARSQDVVDVLEGKPRTGVDFRLERGSVIRGRVTAGDPPRPAPGLLVTLDDEEPLPARPSGKDPSASPIPTRTVATLSAWYRATMCSPAPYELEVNTRVEQLKVGDGQDIERDFRVSRISLPRRTLRGVVRSGRPDGPPIARAIVVGASLEVRDALSHTFADGEGKFELATSSRKCPDLRTRWSRRLAGDSRSYAVRATARSPSSPVRQQSRAAGSSTGPVSRT